MGILDASVVDSERLFRKEATVRVRAFVMRIEKRGSHSRDTLRNKMIRGVKMVEK